MLGSVRLPGRGDLDRVPAQHVHESGSVLIYNLLVLILGDCVQVSRVRGLGRERDQSEQAAELEPRGLRCAQFDSQFAAAGLCGHCFVALSVLFQLLHLQLSRNVSF